MLDRGPVRLQPVHQRLELRVVEQHLILGVIGDVDELLIKQARIDRMQDAADAHCAVPAHQMATVVHRQRRDPVTLSDTQCLERLRHPLGVVTDASPISPRFVPVGPARDNFAAAIFARGMIDQRSNPKRPVLHPTQHHLLPWLFTESPSTPPRTGQIDRGGASAPHFHIRRRARS